MAEETAEDKRTVLERHRRFQNRVAWLFLGLAGIVGLWIILGPNPDDGVTHLGSLLFVELPVFIIFALLGMNALVRAAKGPKAKR